MTNAFPAEALLAQLAVADRRASIAVLQDMTTAERDMARTLLEQVKPNSRIDAGALVRDARSRAVEEAAARMGDGSRAWKYGITLLTDDELRQLRDQLRGRVDGGQGDDELYRRAGLPTYAYAVDAEPDEDAAPANDFDAALDALDGLDDQPKRRRPIKRLRSHRLPPPRAKAKPKQREPFVGGIAAFDQFGRIGGDPSYRPLRPPWLLIDDGDETTDEGDDDARNPSD